MNDEQKSKPPRGGNERLMESGWKDGRKIDLGGKKENWKRLGGRRVFIG